MTRSKPIAPYIFLDAPLWSTPKPSKQQLTPGTRQVYTVSRVEGLTVAVLQKASSATNAPKTCFLVTLSFWLETSFLSYLEKHVKSNFSHMQWTITDTQIAWPICVTGFSQRKTRASDSATSAGVYLLTSRCCDPLNGHLACPALLGLHFPHQQTKWPSRWGHAEWS